MRALILAGALFGLTLAGLLHQPTDALEPLTDHVGQPSCPADGAAMLRVPEGFCIDTTEVSRAHYAAWLATSPPAQDGECADNTSFEPTCQWDGSGDDQPVVCVDWCDAKAYCEGVGKRLCGAIDGGASEITQYDDAESNEWFAACSSGGQYEYTYGDELDTTTCRGADAEDHTTWGVVDVGSFADCESPDSAYAGIYDLSGHVAEWENSCEDGACRIRGGSYQHHAHGLRCAMGERLLWPRERTVRAVGIRCCAD